MVELLYYKDPYMKEFDAAVLASETSEGVLSISTDRTAFYPGGGGQPHDTGCFSVGAVRLPVISVKKRDEIVWHNVDAELVREHSLSQGTVLHGQIEWGRRHLTMRTHTAMHILSAVVWTDYGAQVTGGNMDPGMGRMDFEFATLTKELVSVIETRCNEEVKASHPISTRFLPREEALKIPDLIRTKVNLIPESVDEIRIVEISGLDMQADGGTHVGNTKEVGKVRISDYKSKGAINKRIYLEIS